MRLMKCAWFSAPLVLATLLSACSPAVARPAAHPRAAGHARAAAPRVSPAERLKNAKQEFEASKYAEAEKDFKRAAVGRQRGEADLGLAQVMMETGRYPKAIQTARRVREKKLRPRAAWLEGEVLRRQGKLADAVKALRKVENDPAARRARLLLGEILIEQGKRSDAEAPLMTIVDDYNNDRITENDGDGLSMVGRAAYLLRSPRDANDAFNQAERAKPGDIQTLLWRAELFLEKYDPGHAEEVTREVLKKAPNNPEAHVWMAHVKLDQALDFDAAEHHVDEALKVNPRLAGAYFVLAGIRLRDGEFDESDKEADAGLKFDPENLDLLSMKAAVRFLADDKPGLEKAEAKVLGLNSEYSRMYRIIGDYADWEHRYDDIVKMMRKAVQIDPDDAKAYAQLGLNLIRAGDDPDALKALRSAFDKDPYNVRVFNTLNLYEKVIPREYTTVKYKLFTIRYKKDEKAILERYVPQMLSHAWHEMVKEYRFTPSHPIGVELYAERQNFAIRTSGLPQTAIQGVCFGKTLASMSPEIEHFNIGMTLWHELSHVFHIQMSKSHVPRWFTEGLAEYETLERRPEWKREQDLALYRALRADRLPKVGNMNRAFTRASQLSDVAMAYYASSRILVMLADHYGMPKVDQMLTLWGQGKRTPEVVQTALGVSTADLDAEFRKYIERKLERYRTQFVPLQRAGDYDKARAAAVKAPGDAKAQIEYALAALAQRKGEEAEKAVAAALAADPAYPDAVWLSARIAMAKHNAAGAAAALHKLVAAGHDGYVVEMALADLAEAKKDVAGMKAAFEKAAAFDSSQAEPLEALVDLAHKQHDKDAELAGLRKLALLEEHDGRVYRRLVQALVEKKLYKEAVKFGDMGIYADMENMQMHTLFAQALIGAKMYPRAIYELETAVLCKGTDKQKADAYALLAEAYAKVPNRPAARKAAAQAKKLDPTNPRLKKLKR
jgi:tetratricopeptide (TPR) repeat protein